nr:hypothetical protein [Leisingera methylohalidivorans]
MITRERASGYDAHQSGRRIRTCQAQKRQSELQAKHMDSLTARHPLQPGNRRIDGLWNQLLNVRGGIGFAIGAGARHPDRVKLKKQQKPLLSGEYQSGFRAMTGPFNPANRRKGLSPRRGRGDQQARSPNRPEGSPSEAVRRHNKSGRNPGGVQLGPAGKHRPVKGGLQIHPQLPGTGHSVNQRRQHSIQLPGFSWITQPERRINAQPPDLKPKP